MKKEGLFEEVIDDALPHFKLKDIMQVIAGATVFTIQVALAAEAQSIATGMHWASVLSLAALTVTFVGVFTYFHYHHHRTIKYWGLMLKRTAWTYVISCLTVLTILAIIGEVDIFNVLASINLIVLVALPASVSAVIADSL
jgi:uncharacterized membrane protein